MAQMCNAKEMEWAKEKANLLDAYKKCRQGLERAVRKLKEEKEKQTAMEERRRVARGKRKLKGRLRIRRGVYLGAHPSKSREGGPRSNQEDGCHRRPRLG